VWRVASGQTTPKQSSLEKEIIHMFNFSNYPDIAPGELMELMGAMKDSRTRRRTG
jgi:hypothetical protein